MSFWQRLFGPTPTDMASPWQDNDHLTRVTLTDLYGTLDTDIWPVNRARAMTVPALARARNLLVATAARLPLIAVTRDGRVEPQPALCSMPDPGTPVGQTIGWTVDQLLFYGRAWWVQLSAPDRYRAIPNERIRFAADGYTPIGIDHEPVSSDRFRRIDGPHEGILNFGAASIRAALSIEQAATRAAQNPVPSIELHQTSPTPALSKERIDQLIAGWVAARKGRNGGVAFTTANLETKTHGQAAEQLLIEGRRAAALDMARLVGVPAWVVDVGIDGSSLTYDNPQSRTRDLIDYGLAQFIAPIEARLSCDDMLPAGTWARFETYDLTRGDLKTRAEAYKAAQDAGILTIDQCRAIEAGQPQE